uniref:Lysosomal aspartic protease n=1 Tax=Parasteatoda tepidariorum TaxID=114398 RepID=A0A2L2YW70_PARTP
MKLFVGIKLLSVLSLYLGDKHLRVKLAHSRQVSNKLHEVGTPVKIALPRRIFEKSKYPEPHSK